jgi:hypothetical protein
LLQLCAAFASKSSHPATGNPLLRQNDGRNVLDIIGARSIAADPALQAAVDDAILRVDTRLGGADAFDAAAATSASHSFMKRQWGPPTHDLTFLGLFPRFFTHSLRYSQFRAMLQDKRRTLAMQQHVLSVRLGPADATQPKPPPSPEPEVTVVCCCNLPL